LHGNRASGEALQDHDCSLLGPRKWWRWDCQGRVAVDHEPGPGVALGWCLAVPSAWRQAGPGRCPGSAAVLSFFGGPGRLRI